MRRKCFFAVAVILVVLPAVPVLRSATADDAPQSPPQRNVELARSFLIPAKDETAPSHTPCVVFTADGKRMLTATSDGEIVMFDVATEKLLRRIALPDKAAHAISIDAAGRYAVVSATTGGVSVIDLDTGKSLGKGVAAADCIAASPDGTRVAIARGQQIEILELPSLSRLQTISNHRGPVTNLAWNPNGTLLGSTAKDGRVLVFDTLANRPIYEAIKGTPLYAIAFHPSEPIVAYGGEDRHVYEYSFPSEQEQVISKNQPYWITCLGYSPDGSMITVGDESCDIWLYDRKKNEMVFHNKHHVECWLNSVAWAPDNETFLFGCRPNTHAGKPSVYQPLAVAEAEQTEAAQAKRNALDKVITDQLAKTSDEKQRQALERYRDWLRKPAGLGMMAMGGQEMFFDGDPGPAVLAGGLGDMSPRQPSRFDQKSLAELPEEVQNVAKAYQTTVRDEARRLQSHYCVNQWKVKRQESPPAKK